MKFTFAVSIGSLSRHGIATKLGMALLCSASLVLGTGCAQLGKSDAGSVASAIAAADRSDADKARDVQRLPAQVLAFLDIGPGLVVMDVIAASGYYSETLAAAVGPTGTVYAQNPGAVLKMRDGANDKAMKARLAGGRLPNVVRLDRDFPKLGLAPGSLDAAFTALNLHDVYNRDPDQAKGMLTVLHGLLKPGGILGIVDHVGIDGQDNAKLHRMRKADAIAVAQAAGFELVADSDLLGSDTDEHTLFVFAPEARGQTDRFLLKLRKGL